MKCNIVMEPWAELLSRLDGIDFSLAIAREQGHNTGKIKDTRMISFKVMSLLHSSDFATVIVLLKRLG